MFNTSAFACFTLLSTAVFAANNTCVTLFDSEPEHFDICRTTECFVFRSQVPFVWLPETMKSIEQQKPFPCSDHKPRFKGPKGPFFNIINATDKLRGNQCVWGGIDCQFDDMVNFVRRSTRLGDHKFIAGGLLFRMAYRISNETIASIPLLEDELIVIGPRYDDDTTFEHQWTALRGPFTRLTWILLFVVAVSLVLVRACISFYFTDPWSFNRFHDNFLGHYEPAQSHQKLGRNRLPRFRDLSDLRRLNTYLSYSVKSIFVIVFLFYEISIASFLISDHHERMEGIDPKQFVIIGNTTQERVFENYIRGNDFGTCLDGDAAPCWKRVSSYNEVFSTITSENGLKPDQYRYSVLSETLNRYRFKKRPSLCKELRVLDYAPLNRRLMGVWYFSSNIPRARRREMNKAIVGLQEEDKIRGFVDAVSGLKLLTKCEKSDYISYRTLIMPLLICSYPILCAISIYICSCTLRRFNLQEETETWDSDSLGEVEYDPRFKRLPKRYLRDGCFCWTDKVQE